MGIRVAHDYSDNFRRELNYSTFYDEGNLPSSVEHNQYISVIRILPLTKSQYKKIFNTPEFYTDDFTIYDAKRMFKKQPLLTVKLWAEGEEDEIFWLRSSKNGNKWYKYLLHFHTTTDSLDIEPFFTYLYKLRNIHKLLYEF
jgi:hypothetical protein